MAGAADRRFPLRPTTAALALVTGALLASGALGAADAARRASPDLVVRSVSHERPATGARRLMVTVSVRNAGRAGAARSRLGLRLSRNRRLDRRDVRLAVQRTIRRLPPGRRASRSLTVVLPRTLPPGRYWLFACADDRERVRERRERNNCRRAGRRVIVRRAPAAGPAPVVPGPRPVVPGPAPGPGAGQGTGGGQPRPDPEPDPGPAAVGPEGGRVVAAGGAVALDFPPGALSERTTITVTRVAEHPGRDFVPGTVFELGPSGSAFLEPVTVSIAVDPAAVNGPPGDLQLAELAGDVVEDRPTAPVDVSRRRVVGQLRGFSTVGVRQGVPWPGPRVTATWNADRTITVRWSAVATPAGPPGTVAEVQRAVLTGTLREPTESEWFPRAFAPAMPLTDPAGPGAGVYWYRARWAAGSGRSLWSAPVRVVVFGRQAPPPAPAEARAQAIACGGIRLSWAHVAEAGAYELERSEAGGAFAFLATAGSTDLSFVDAGVAPGRRYDYRIFAVNGAGRSSSAAVAGAEAADSELTLTLSSRAIAIPPGRSATVRVAIVRHTGPFDVALAYEPQAELDGVVQVAFEPTPTAGDSVARFTVDPRAGRNLAVRGTIRATAVPPASGTCTAPITVDTGEPRCDLAMPDLIVPPAPGQRRADLFVTRIGFGDLVDLVWENDDGSFGDFAEVSFVPDPAANRSTAVIDVVENLPPDYQATASVSAVPPEGVAAACTRQIRISGSPPG